MTERWAELRWNIPRKKFDLLSSVLFDLGCIGVQEEHLPGQTPPPRQPWDSGPEAPPPQRLILKAWWEIKDKPVALDGVKRLLLKYPDCAPPEWFELGVSDWGESWKKNFNRIVITEKLAVSPPWESFPGDIVIEPGLAFGTGDHPTTRSCLEAISAWGGKGRTCLDVGCGSGVLALAASKFGMKAFGVDIDSVAVDSARKNAEMNGLQATFETTPLDEVQGSYDLVVANLFAELLVQLSPDILRLGSGKFAFAGILADRHRLVLDAFSSLRLIRLHQEGDWVSIWYEK